MSLTNVFSLQEVNVCYPATSSAPARMVLQQVSLTIAEHDKVAILGPNGAGKSTLLSALSGCPAIDNGKLCYCQRSISTIPHTELAKLIAFLPQHNPVIPGLTCFEVAAMGLLPHKAWFERDNQADIDVIHAALAQTGLLNKVQHRVETLSGGEWQRLTLARALVQHAQVLLLDEPTNHLDIQYQHQLMHLLKGMKKTVVCALHDINLAARYFDKIILLHEGRVVAYGRPVEVLQPERLKAVFALDAEVTVHAKYGWIQVNFIAAEPA